MKDWEKSFKSYAGSDVYSINRRADSGEIERKAVARGLVFFKVDLSNVATKEDFLRAIAEALKFPSYFGMNWDAFEECINDLEWFPAPGYVIVLDSAEAFARKAPGDFKMAGNIFKAAAKGWKARKKPFYVFLVNK